MLRHNWQRLRKWFRVALVRKRSDIRLSRFIFTEGHFSRTKKAVKHRAFLPPGDGRLSVFDTEGVDEQEIWSIGGELAVQRTQTLYARADIGTGIVISKKLRVVVDEPPPRHRNIIGWPPATQKEDRMLIAMELAAASVLQLP